jgi:hypothetical protein
MNFVFVDKKRKLDEDKTDDDFQHINEQEAEKLHYKLKIFALDNNILLRDIG